MLRFQHISHLLSLGLVPVIILLFVGYIYWRRNKRKKLGNERLVNEQIKGFMPGRVTLKFIILSIAVTMLAIGWANLQMGAKTENIQRKGVDVVIALDVSKSMLAKDIQPDRLTRAKQLITRIVDKMQNDRVALVVFAGRAYLQVPLTIDYSAMKMMLQNVSPNLIPTQGTVISDAIDLSMNSFSQKEKKYKSLVIISDGEDHDEKAIAKAKDASDAGIIIHTIGVGSPQGTTIVDPETKKVKLDENGTPVLSRLNEEELKQIAVAGKGSYSLLQNTDRVASKITDEIDNMEQKNLGAVVFTDYKSFFQYFLGIALAALLLEWFLPSSYTGSRSKTKVKTA